MYRGRNERSDSYNRKDSFNRGDDRIYEDDFGFTSEVQF